MDEKAPIETSRVMYPAGEDMLELPARGVLRVLVPMSDWQVRRSGSKLYPALSLKGRARRAALRTWITLGGARFSHRVTVKGEGGWPLGDVLREDLPALSTVAVSIGPSSPGQKTTAQLMDARGRILGFAKYADRSLTRNRVSNEARMLGMLPEGVGPRLIRFMPFEEGVLLVQSPLPGRAYRPRLRIDDAQLHLLQRMIRSDDPLTASKHPFVQSLHAQAGPYRAMLDSVVTALGEERWHLAYMHGDLAPWNVRWRRGECLAFDWECGLTHGFAYVDAAYMLIQVAGLIRGLPPGEAGRVVAERLRDRLPAPYGGSASAITALGALYTLLSWYPPSESTGDVPSAQEQWLRALAETVAETVA